MRIYEGMFVLDERRANENWGGVTAEVRELLERNGGQILTAEKWDERRLAYPIKGRTRAIYFLVRFTAPPNAIAELEHQCQLNDNILRVLFTRDKRAEKLHKKGLPITGAEKEEAAAQAEQPQETPAEGGEQPQEEESKAQEPATQPAGHQTGEEPEGQGEPPADR